ncbi:cysteine proteinase [Hypoxylon sp. FL1284]|nr:cysteine proteinase [Hypoxylon sp. FL1284]
MEATQDALSPASPTADDVKNNGARRSTRTRKAPPKYDQDNVVPNSQARGQPATKRTAPKRKAAQAATQNMIPEDPHANLEDTLSRMSPDERREYNGWVQLESEPGFFGAMLHELGANDFAIQEIYSLGADTWKELPHPVHGLIFLFEYEGDGEQSDAKDRRECPDELWFANQTTANSCATVALINIIMNAQDSDLGTQLKDFRSTTQRLPPPHRGYFLDKNDFIRSIHNSLARRIDLIAEDLTLDNKYEDAQTTEKTQKKGGKVNRKRKKKKSADSNYHYIAYVPVSGQVWELDGLNSKPRCLGPIPQSEDAWWLDIAGEAIQECMMRNSEYSSYNLLAICQSPLKNRARELAENLACSFALHKHSEAVSGPFTTFTDARLGQFNLTRDFIVSLPLPASFNATVNEPAFDSSAAHALAEELELKRESLEALLVSELEIVDEMMRKFRGRQRDYTPAIHEWVRLLAQKRALRGLIQEMDQGS